MDIKWERGTFYEFRATTKIHIGAVKEDIYEDDLVEFDGQTCRYAGRDFAVPSLRAALKAGWLVPSEDNVSRYVPQPAGVHVRPATPQTLADVSEMGFETASEEEAVAGTLEAHQNRRKSAGLSKLSKSFSGTSAGRPGTSSSNQEAPPVQRAPVPVEAPLAPEDVPAEDISSIPTKGFVERADAINRARIAQAMSQEVPPPVKSETGDSSDVPPPGGFQVVSMDGQEGQKTKSYHFSSGAAVGAPGSKNLREGVPLNKMQRNLVKPVATTPQETKPRPVGQKTQVPAEGNISIKENLEGVATGDVAEAISGEELTDLLPSAARVPEAPSGDFKWDMSLHWKTRVKKAIQDHGDDPKTLASIKAVESPGVCKSIDEELSKR